MTYGREIMNGVVTCTEEELAPFFMWPFRHRDGWRWLPFYLRGPAMPGIIGPLLTPLGIWLFSRSPRRLADVSDSCWLGSRVLRSCSSLGSYGMGGPGFLGLRCENLCGRFWIVFTLISADSWLTLDGKLLESALHKDEKRAFGRRGVVPLEMIHGGRIETVEFGRECLVIKITGENASHLLELRRDGATVPPWRGTGGRKKFSDRERLEDVVVVSRNARLWVQG